MDAESIRVVLEAGRIGGMAYSDWCEQMYRVLSLDAPRYMGVSLTRVLSELGIASIRWEPGDSNPDEQKLWQTYLVLGLPEATTASKPPLKLIDDMAVEACRSFFYSLRGDELWIEYLVARPEVRDTIEQALKNGKIGELPFPRWFRYNPASTGIENMAYSLAVRGVTAVRWETDYSETRGGIYWQAYVVDKVHNKVRGLYLVAARPKYLPFITTYRRDSYYALI